MAQPQAPVIVLREVRITREISGELRILEVVDIDLGADADSSAAGRSLAAVRLQESAQAVMGVGGDIELTDVRYDPPFVYFDRLPPGQTELQVGLTYRLPAGASVIEFTAPWPTRQFAVSIARGNIDARIDPRLARTGSVGSASRPRERYLAEELAAEDAVRIRIRTGRVGWRERLAVLLVSALAAALAAAWIWNRRAAPAG